MVFFGNVLRATAHSGKIFIKVFFPYIIDFGEFGFVILTTLRKGELLKEIDAKWNCSLSEMTSFIILEYLGDLAFITRVRKSM